MPTHKLPDEEFTFVGKAVPSRWGGTRCRLCGGAIDSGTLIVKVATGGTTTQHGQGPGIWVCASHDTRNSQQEMGW